MRRVAHLSDLHFGTADDALLNELCDDVLQGNPDLVVVTGDLTQRARSREFALAAKFLARLTVPKLVIPGNHDIAPLYRPMRRAVAPYERYRESICAELNPVFDDGELLVLGVDSVSRWRWKEGLLSRRALEALVSRAEASRAQIRVVAFHHPLIATQPKLTRTRARSREVLLAQLEAAHVQLVLAGHLHKSFSGPSHSRLGRAGSLVVVQASTSSSSRLRGHPNSYNRIVIHQRCINVEVRHFEEGRFRSGRAESYTRAQRVWHAA